jgi:hypothetical protein
MAAEVMDGEAVGRGSRLGAGALAAASAEIGAPGAFPVLLPAGVE